MSELVYEVPDALLMEAGLGVGSGIAIRCDEPGCVHVPLDELRGPIIAPGKRGLKLDRLRRILLAIADDTAMVKAVRIYREDGAAQAVILNGAHRYAVAHKLGCATLPCIYLSREDAVTGFRYPECL
jgi:hypothetical protein